jgi:hypothetical protein
MSTIIEEIRTRMLRYPQAQIEYDEYSIAYHPPASDGFVVRLIVKSEADRERYFVLYSGCCQMEENRLGSVITFGWGLSTGCRLREFSRNAQAYHWITDIESPSGWKPYWEEYRFCAGSGAFGPGRSLNACKIDSSISIAL